jgi:histidinol-phosphatase
LTAPISTRAFLDFAVDAAWQAGQLTLSHFQTGIKVDWKVDASPVTAADRGAEELLRSLIGHKYPHHAIIGEEYGAANTDSAHRWIIDPIDGTQSFIRGVPLYGVLIGLEIGSDPVVGVVHFPALGEMVAAARGEGCRWNGRPVHVSSAASLEESLVLYTEVSGFPKYGKEEAWRRIQHASRVQRGWGDCYGHCMVATGRAEVMLDPAMNVWDSAPLLPILEEAGGTFTDWMGTATIHGDDAFSTNGIVLQELLQLMGVDEAV